MAFNKHSNCSRLHPSNFGFTEGDSATTPTDMPVITACFSEPFLDSKSRGHQKQGCSRLYCGMPVFFFFFVVADVDNEEKAKCEQCVHLLLGDPDQQGPAGELWGSIREDSTNTESRYEKLRDKSSLKVFSCHVTKRRRLLDSQT